MASRLQDVHLRTTTALKPLATAVAKGTIHYDTDIGILTRSNGTVWESYSGVGGGDVIGPAVAVDGNVALYDGITGKLLKDGGPFALGGRLIGIQLFKTPGAGVYTPTVGTNFIEIELVGGGGGGSGVASAGASQVNLGGSGAGAAWLFALVNALFAGAAYVVGAKGTGGAAGNNNGTGGVSTTFQLTGGGTLFTAGGGGAGTPKTSFAPPITHFGGIGGVAINGDLFVNGQGNNTGIAPNAFVGWSCPGGASQYSRGAEPSGVASGTSTAGNNAPGFGGGGAGAVSCNSGGAKAGGNGSDGFIRIREYS